MNLHQTIAGLVKAQDNFNADAYASCFTADAVVIDEGHTYQGKAAIRNWIAAANKKYQAKMKPLDWKKNILKTELSGDFPGSPVIVEYQFEFEGELISSLKIV